MEGVAMRAATLVLALFVSFVVSATPALAASLDLDAASVGFAPGAPAAGDRTVAQTVWFQGFLADGTTGDPVNATYDVIAQMYTAESGGTSLWGPETHASTPILNGWFNIELGKTAALPAFSSPPYYLQLTVNGEILAPRLKLASVPSSLRAQSAEGAPDDGDWSVAGSNIYRLTGNVGIGDATPDGRFDVQSTLSGAAIIATATGSTAYGVDSEAFGTSGTFYGVSGEANSTESSSCYGLYGKATGSGSLYGVYGEATGTGSVYGVCGSSPGVGVGVCGTTSGSSVEQTSYGVMGMATNPHSVGVYGFGPYQGVAGLNSVTNAMGVLGVSSTGVYGYSPSGYAGNFSGDVHVSGKLGVGRDLPTVALDVSDVVRVRGNTWPASDTGKSMELAYNPTAHRGYVQVYNRDAGGGWGQLYLGDGNVGIGSATDYTHKLDVAGDIQCVALLETSDDRLKTDVRVLDGALDALEGIRGVSFEWSGEAAAAGATPGERGIGVLAGEVERVFPELVSSPEGSYRAVDYTKLTAVLIEAVKQLREENRALESRVAELEGAIR
jgi:hypothetical protein